MDLSHPKDHAATIDAPAVTDVEVQAETDDLQVQDDPPEIGGQQAIGDQLGIEDQLAKAEARARVLAILEEPVTVVELDVRQDAVLLAQADPLMVAIAVHRWELAKERLEHGLALVVVTAAAVHARELEAVNPRAAKAVDVQVDRSEQVADQANVQAASEPAAELLEAPKEEREAAKAVPHEPSATTSKRLIARSARQC